MEALGGGGDDVLVEGVPVAIVGDEEGEVEQVVGETGDAPADAQEQRAGLRGQERGRGTGGGEGVVQHRGEKA